jgi:hypothetical protein
MKLDRMLCLPAMLLVIGCTDEPEVNIDFDDDTTFAGRVANLEPGDRFAMLTENGAVRLALTNERVYVQVSEAVREHVDSTMRDEFDESGSRIARSIGSAVRRGVVNALEFDVHFDVDEIRDVEYANGELVFDFEDSSRDRTLRNMEIDGQPLTRSFSEQDARAFVAAFRRLKRGETADTSAAAEPARDTAVSGPSADTSGGASF